MSDPERISQRSSGLAARLLQAGADEQPATGGVERTLAALGVTGALVTAAGGATAAGATSAVAATGKAVGGVLLAKWVGVGVLGGVVLSGAAAAVSAPPGPVPAPAPSAVVAPRPAPLPAMAVPSPESREVAMAQSVASEERAVAVAPTTPRAAPSTLAVVEEAPEVGAPLAAEVAAIDRARALLGSGQSEQGLAELRRYEREFPNARLLPEVLFLRMETSARLGRHSDAKAAVARLLQGFPESPHAARARQLLSP